MKADNLTIAPTCCSNLSYGPLNTTKELGHPVHYVSSYLGMQQQRLAMELATDLVLLWNTYIGHLTNQKTVLRDY